MIGKGCVMNCRRYYVGHLICLLCHAFSWRHTIYCKHQSKNARVIYRSRVAQWKRAGPITQRSEDRNLALLTLLSAAAVHHFTHRQILKCLVINIHLVSKDRFSTSYTRTRAIIYSPALNILILDQLIIHYKWQPRAMPRKSTPCY